MSCAGDVALETSDEDLLREYADIKDYSEEDKLLTEKEYTGIYLSGHPLSRYVDFINKYVNVKSIDFVKEVEEGLLR